MARQDFLRHIVNVKLSEYSKKNKSLVPVLDEIRKLLSSAEEQYGFSIYGGRVENLARYLRSSDFDLVISTLKSANALDILVDILREVIDKYSDVAEVVEAARERIESIEKGITRLDEAGVIAEALSKKLKDATIKQSPEGAIDIEYKGLKARILIEKDGYTLVLNVDTKTKYNNYTKPVEILYKIYEAIRKSGA